MSSSLSRPSYSSSSRTSSPFFSNHSSLINGDTPRSRSLSFLSASPQELCLRSQRKSVQSSVVLQDGAVVVTNSSPIEKLKDELLSIPSQEVVAELGGGEHESTVSITVVGASGDLAKKKIFPALFALTMKAVFLRANCSEKMEEFLKRCFYHTGQYDSQEHFVALDKKLKEHEGGRLSNRLFYLSIPPNIFVDAVKCASSSASSLSGWTRVIVEKPFGRDSKTSAALTNSLKHYLEEDQIFRIDHYLGKELVENLSVLRFSNLIFEPLWSRQYIQNVQFIFSEDFGTEGRGGYFDHYGIIRDIMQNHLLQILALFAMETPVSLDAEDIRNEKVKVLRSMRPIQLEDVVIGQYKGTAKGGVTYPGYTDDTTVPKDSLTPTFAAAALFIDNVRWDGVPFLMKAGKALHTRSWRKLANMNVPRHNFAYAVVNGLLYVIRGFSSFGDSLLSTEVYNPKTNQWSLMDCPYHPVWRGFAFSFKSKLFVVSNESRFIDIYDPKTETWKELDSGQSLSVYSYTVIRNKVYFFDRKMPGLGVFDPEENSWSWVGVPRSPGGYWFRLGEWNNKVILIARLGGCKALTGDLDKDNASKWRATYIKPSGSNATVVLINF
ncbi:hypothetical protein F2Q68_00005649 [Brassica cretica]|uniref:glucose-6-phosphate dehydrogenase (NADP(+)) n=1 Tax=Brassica cretica TaxID=69181 RepID=A0A8S9J800_BRACR|nr:hypothetical protein F2Q68_00005649 [Brassica cretica]